MTGASWEVGGGILEPSLNLLHSGLSYCAEEPRRRLRVLRLHETHQGPQRALRRRSGDAQAACRWIDALRAGSGVRLHQEWLARTGLPRHRIFDSVGTRAPVELTAAREQLSCAICTPFDGVWLFRKTGQDLFDNSRKAMSRSSPVSMRNLPPRSYSESRTKFRKQQDIIEYQWPERAAGSIQMPVVRGRDLLRRGASS